MATPKKTDTKTTEIRVNRTGGLSPRKLDELKSASGWKMTELFDDTGDPTGKLMAGKMWLAARDVRPDLTPQDFYDMDIENPAASGIEISYEPELDPTTAAG